MPNWRIDNAQYVIPTEERSGMGLGTTIGAEMKKIRRCVVVRAATRSVNFLFVL